ncbi:hypothetical protein AGMMS49992_20620 [Clostridia bacterium]|nr:hypothetical protein AGMMS49992_20620 [Clostridia bacterium]
MLSIHPISAAAEPSSDRAEIAKEYLTTADVANILGISRRHAIKLIQADIPHLNLSMGRQAFLRVPAKAFEEWCAKRTRVIG